MYIYTERGAASARFDRGAAQGAPPPVCQQRLGGVEEAAVDHRGHAHGHGKTERVHRKERKVGLHGTNNCTSGRCWGGAREGRRRVVVKNSTCHRGGGRGGGGRGEGGRGRGKGGGRRGEGRGRRGRREAGGGGEAAAGGGGRLLSRCEQ